MRATERNLSHDEEDLIEEICQNLKLSEDENKPNENKIEAQILILENLKESKTISELSPGAKFVLYEEMKALFPDLLTALKSKDKVSIFFLLLFDWFSLSQFQFSNYFFR